MTSRSFFNRAHLASGLALALAVALTGCGQDSVTGPVSENAPSRAARGGLEENGVVTGTFSTSAWTLVGSKSIGSAGGTVTGGRYTLTIPSKALTSTNTITISQLASNILDAEFGPAGLKFSKPVTLVMNYAGTNADPASSNYNGTQPAYFQYNSSTGTWTSIAGTLNTSAKTFTVQISSFNPAAASTGGGFTDPQAKLPPPGTGDW